MRIDRRRHVCGGDRPNNLSVTTRTCVTARCADSARRAKVRAVRKTDSLEILHQSLSQILNVSGQQGF